MRRREFIASLGGATFWPVSAKAQQAERTYRIAVLSQNLRTSVSSAAFFDELRKLGFLEGRNLLVDARGYGSRSDQFSELALALVSSGIDAFVSGGDAAIRAVQQVTRTIPIVGTTDDMVGAGLVRSLAKPGGNTTGMSILATELDSKRLEILIELVAGVRHMAALADPAVTSSGHLQSLQDDARTHGVELSIYRIVKAEEIIGAIDDAKTMGAAALNVLATPLLNAHRQLIIERAAALRLPAIYQWPEIAKDGGLVAYGPSFVQIARRNAEQLAKVLGGIKPADLPVQQPTKFELVINLKTARALGLTVPPTLLIRADEVIE